MNTNHPEIRLRNESLLSSSVMTSPFDFETPYCKVVGRITTSAALPPFAPLWDILTYAVVEETNCDHAMVMPTLGSIEIPSPLVVVELGSLGSKMLPFPPRGMDSYTNES